MNPLYGSTLHSPPLEQYKMLEHATFEKSQVLAPRTRDYFAAASVREALGAEHAPAAGDRIGSSNLEGSSTGACSTEGLQAVASETVAVAGSRLRKFEVTDARLSRASMRSIQLAPEPACSKIDRCRRTSAMLAIVAAHGRGCSSSARLSDRPVGKECGGQ